MSNIIANGRTDHYTENSRKVDEMQLSEPPSVDRLNWLLYIQHVRGEVQSCKKLIKEEIARSNGKNEYAHYKEGIILREEGRVQEALEAFQICHKLNAGNTQNIKEIAKCLYLLRRYRLSYEAYAEAEKGSEKADWEVLHNIGQCLMLLGNVSKAREYVHKAVQCGKQEESYALLIKMLLIENDIRSAIAVCNAALDTSADSVNMLTKSGLLYIKTGQTQLAFERLSSSLALDPFCTEALLGIGCITQSHEEYDVALTKYKLAVQNRPDSVALWNNIGMCFYSKQKYIAAITCLKRALWLSPLNARVLLNLGMVHLSTQQPASAFNFLCAAVNLRPDASISFVLLGCALAMLEDSENALRAMRQALSLAPDQAIVLLDTAILCYENRYSEEARDLLAKFDEQIVGQEQNSGGNLNELIALAERLKLAITSEEQRNRRITAGDNRETTDVDEATGVAQVSSERSEKNGIFTGVDAKSETTGEVAAADAGELDEFEGEEEARQDEEAVFDDESASEVGKPCREKEQDKESERALNKN